MARVFIILFLSLEFFIFQVCFCLACRTCSLPTDRVPSGYTETVYTASMEHVENPSRGFCVLEITRASHHTELTVGTMDWYRQEHGITWYWREFILDTFVDRDISEDYLNSIRKDLQNMREARVTAILRMLYTDVYVTEAPYGDATKAWILRHIEQLQPIFSEYEDVIDIVQAGFIGTWGEWYYTTYFGDPNDLDWDDPALTRGLTERNWQDRGDVLRAIMEAVPKSIQIQTRYMQAKWVIWGDDTVTTEKEMKNQTDKARTAHHNDCFVSSPDDVGTYIDKDTEYPWLQLDTRYSVQGGETCSLSKDSPDRHKCPTAKKELEELHFTFLNQAYNQIIYNEWKKDDCYPEIHRRLGYRLVLKRTLLPRNINTGDQFCFRLDFANLGFAAPIRQMAVSLVLRHSTSGQLYSVPVPEVDVRTWLPKSPIVIDGAANTPHDLAPGQYDVLLAIKRPLTEQYSDYNILLANTGVPEYKVGLNNLQHQIQVTGESGRPGSHCSTLSLMADQVPSRFERRYCAYGGCQGKSECKSYPLQNPSFETTGDWVKFGRKGFSYTKRTASQGRQSIKIRNGGARQVLSFPAGVTSFQLTASSKSSRIRKGAGSGYSIYCDVKLDDGSWLYGQTHQFPTDRDDWTLGSLVVTSAKGLSKAWCYAMFRGYNRGVAYFDDFQAWTADHPITDCRT